MVAFDAGRLQFFGALADLAARNAFMALLAPLRTTEWVVDAKRPFGGPEGLCGSLHASRRHLHWQERYREQAEQSRRIAEAAEAAE